MNLAETEQNPQYPLKTQLFERSFIMIKPDGVQRGQVGLTISKFEERGFKMAAMKLVKAERSIVTQHYADLKEKGFFNGLVEYILSGPVCCMVWEGDHVVATARKMLGLTRPVDADPGSVRGDMCLDVGRNSIHGSDSVEAANREISLWFTPSELVSWRPFQQEWVREAKD